MRTACSSRELILPEDLTGGIRLARLVLKCYFKATGNGFDSHPRALLFVEKRTECPERGLVRDLVTAELIMRVCHVTNLHA